MSIPTKLITATIVCFALFATSARAQGTYELIVETGQTIPGVSESVDDLHRFICCITESGTIVFFWEDANGAGYLSTWTSGQFTNVLTAGTPELDDTYWFRADGVSDTNLPFFARLTSTLQTVYDHDPLTSSFQKLFTPGGALPDGNGEFSEIYDVHVSRTGKSAMLHRYQNTVGGTTDNSGIWLCDNGICQQIVREGDATPDGNDIFDLFLNSGGDLSINATGQFAFPAILNNATQKKGVYLWNGTSIVEIASDGKLDPSGDAYFVYYQASLNDSGQVAFAGDSVYVWDNNTVTESFQFPITFDSIQYTAPRSGVLQFNNLGNILFDARNFDAQPKDAIGLVLNGSPVRLVEDGQPMPDGRTFDVEWPETLSALNDFGVVAVKGSTNGVDGSRESIYLTDGTEYLRVALEDDVVNGLTIENLECDWSIRQGGKFLNDFGQVVFMNQDSDTGGNGYGPGSIHLFTPDLQWRSNQSGNWDNKDNWTLGLPPAHVHQVSIGGSADVVVTGPSSDATVKRLTVGGDPAVHSVLQLQDATLTATEGLMVLEGGILSGSGAVVADVEAFGDLSPGLSPGEITVAGDMTLHASALTKVEVDGTALKLFDRLIVQGDVHLNGSLSVVFSTRSFLAAGQQFLIGDFAGTVTGQFANAPEGTVVHSQGSLQVEVSYVLGDGNDFGLVVSTVDAVQPFGRKLLDGVEVGGTIGDTDDSDDVYYELDPSPTNNPAKQIVEMILLAESPVTNPSSFSFRLEAAMSGGPAGDVIQTIELWNETGQQWEVLDTRSASNADSTVHVTATGDLARFIHPLTDEIIAKVKWVSPELSGSPFDWSIDIDQLGWLIGS